ncbi:hypothetical protein EON63_03950 [archaeon]|nr:MAG: hypothetical protein EON63_03950 [archaeon]
MQCGVCVKDAEKNFYAIACMCMPTAWIHTEPVGGVFSERIQHIRVHGVWVTYGMTNSYPYPYPY